MLCLCDRYIDQNIIHLVGWSAWGRKQLHVPRCKQRLNPDFYPLFLCLESDEADLFWETLFTEIKVKVIVQNKGETNRDNIVEL